MINPAIHRFLSIGLVLLISSAGMTWGTQAFANNHCDKNDDKNCNHSEKNQKSTPKGPVVTINPSSGPIATLVTITGNGFAPFSTVVISFEGDIRATVTSTSNGGFTDSITNRISLIYVSSLISFVIHYQLHNPNKG